jgi:beta-galactosidase
MTADGGVIQPPRDTTQVSMDPGWMFIKQDVTGAEALAFNDATWTTVSTPHTYNDIDSYRVLANHSSGDTGTYTGPAWYRKHFKIASQYSNSKVIIEFERIRQGARFYINGAAAGVYDDGVTACGIDVTGKVNFGATENVLAVRVDNSDNYAEASTGVAFEWEGKAFNPNYGGLIGHVWLHLPGKIYQTYPLYNNLQTTGIYVYPSNFANVSPSQGDLTVNVESEVKNESGSAQTVGLTTDVVDPATGMVVTTFQSAAPTAVPDATSAVIKASGPLTKANLWSDVTPNLYTVVTKVTAGGTVVDTRTTLTGFRQTAFKGGVGTGGTYVNGRFVYLLGFAQRASNDWAALGEAVPDWMHDYHANLIRAGNSNYIRWMHITPQRIDVIANDKFGVINIAPAGDKEGDATGVQWTQRTNVMRASMIYLRNNPSILFWEAGNNGVTGAHMQEMQNLRKQWDPNGGRAIGCRSLADTTAAPFAEYFGTIVAYDPTFDPTTGGYFRGYSNAYRDQAPEIEAEDERDEAARRFWDNYSPPHMGFTPGPNDTYHWNQETFITGDATSQAAIWRLDIWKNQFSIRNTDSLHSRYSGYASIYFADSDADGRQMSSEVCRVSGKVDAVRLPKEIYYAHQVVGNTQPQVHIIGHWTYPANTTKTMYVVANTPSVELFVNGTSIGKSSTPTNTYLFSFPAVAWTAGTIKAVGYDSSGANVAQYQLQTAGAPAKIRLSATVDPNGGLKADGADVAMFDVEVLDANGQRIPTDEAPIAFTMSGPGVWRGGYNSGVLGSTNATTLLTECGVNRVFIRSTLTPGTIALTASRSGLTSDTVSVTSSAIPVVDGLY